MPSLMISGTDISQNTSMASNKLEMYTTVSHRILMEEVFRMRASQQTSFRIVFYVIICKLHCKLF